MTQERIINISSQLSELLQPVILCGGTGTRLWPLSRKLFPKQFIELGQDSTLLGETLERVARLSSLPSLVVCNNEYRFLAAQELASRNLPGTVVLEPVKRNTAPAVAVAALIADPEQMLLVLPADHRLGEGEAFSRAVELGLEWAAKGKLVCFGVPPSNPETGYGYLHRGEPMGRSVFEVNQFVEKPSEERAAEFLASGEHYWNSGIFLFRAADYLAALKRFAPEMLEQCRKAVDGASKDLDFLRLQEEAFEACPADSIDYAIMEKSDYLCLVELSGGWSDIGSWKTLAESCESDENGNVLVGDVITSGTKNCYVHSQTALVAAIGLEDAVVVESGDALLVARKDCLDEVKSLVKGLLAKGRKEAHSHAKVYRPWGSFESIALGERFQVKSIIVKPGQILSLQKHRHRAEHWVVVRGTAKVVNGDQELLLCEDQSTYIPIGNVHRLENPGDQPLEIIEVQTGAYLGEDDIVRLEDVYGRKGEIPTS